MRTALRISCLMILLLVPAQLVLAGEWVHLGKRTANFRADRDVIKVGAKDDRYNRIKLKAGRNGIEMIDLKIHFVNGEIYDVPLRLHIKPGGETRAIDLPGHDRQILKVEFFYRSLGRKHGKAVIHLLGLR